MNVPDLLFSLEDGDDDEEEVDEAAATEMATMTMLRATIRPITT